VLIRTVGLKQIVSGLARCKLVEKAELSLCDLRLTKESGDHIEYLLKEFRRLKKLKLMLFRNDIGDTGLIKISRGLLSCSKLEDALLCLKFKTSLKSFYFLSFSLNSLPNLSYIKIELEAKGFSKK